MRKAYIALFIVWLIAALSLVGIHFILKGTRKSTVRANTTGSLISSLDSGLQKSISYFDSGVVKLSDEKYHFIGKGFEGVETELIQFNKLAVRKIDLAIEDPLLFERKMLSAEAFRRLNNAEKKCLADNNASLLYKNGSFFLIYDPIIYEKNVIRYEKDCSTCEELKKKIAKK